MEQGQGKGGIGGSAWHRKGKEGRRRERQREERVPARWNSVKARGGGIEGCDRGKGTGIRGQDSGKTGEGGKGKPGARAGAGGRGRGQWEGG